jgi:hypothetical protein
MSFCGKKTTEKNLKPPTGASSKGILEATV